MPNGVVQGIWWLDRPRIRPEIVRVRTALDAYALVKGVCRVSVTHNS